MEQLIRIDRKHNIKLNAIFESNLVTARSGLSFSGYAQTFPQFLAALQGRASNDTAGPVTVDLDSDIGAVDQLWDEVHGVIDATNTWMETSLLLFGVMKGNKLSPFLCDIQTPGALGEHWSVNSSSLQSKILEEMVPQQVLMQLTQLLLMLKLRLRNRMIQKTLWK